MEWFEITFYVSIAVMLLQSVLSFIFGDMDVTADFELDDVLSFKGIVHFIIGFTCVLTVTGTTSTFDYVYAFLIGVLFMIGLQFVYRIAYRGLKQEIVYTNVLENVDAEVYYYDSESKKGEVFVTLEGRRVQLDLRCGAEVELKAGDKIKVSGTRTNVYKV